MSSPVRQRRERERANVRARIAAVALAILESEGAGALTVRRVAAEVEYTPPIVYQHFDGKDGLLLVLVEHGYQQLHLDMSAAVSGPGEGLLAGAEAYLRYAGAHPHLYQAMNNTLLDGEARKRAAMPVIELTYAALTGWSAAHSVELDPEEACEIVWGTLHGMASLGHLGTIGPDRAVHLGVAALDAILRGWLTRA
ncbi:AcrR family transcriptional regulator [Catenuloplanes nepalensis]|uniref:AcrR family transcriptional regulator n=1 Tax=Catenuloplanes nepalensis TaxID=587533 RepID=A0ABT9MQ07_9ACTN|nr:TetR/AcrR family transcriptional regulator [Catenuloplanes nepalensis]MDP9793505.1 AcrR family transcriptional regulator [Catenuloplanes nepalensis]